MPPKFQQISSIIAHEADVNCVSIGRRTGKVYASGGEDRLLNLWQIGGKSPIITFGPFQSSLTTCTFSDNEDKILAGNNGGTVMLFNLNEQRNEATWSAHRSAVNDVCFHTQNKSLIVTCGYDGKVNLLSKQQRHPVQWFANHKGPANTVDISPDGRFIATGGDDKTVRIFDLDMGKEISKFSTHSDRVTCVRFHPSEPILCSCSDDRSLKFYDLEMNKEIDVSYPLDSQSVSLVRFAPNDPCLCSLSQDCLKIVGWEPATVFQKIPFGFPNPRDLAVVYDTIFVASTTKDRVIIQKMKTTGVKPFSSVSLNADNKQSKVFDYEPQTRSRGSTPRLLDMNEIPKANKSRAVSQKRPESTFDRFDDDDDFIPQSNKVNGSSSRGRLLRPGSVDTTKEKEEQRSTRVLPQRFPQTTSKFVSATSIYSDFRKERTPFMSAMNERYSKLARINEALDTLTLGELLKQIAESGKQATEILSIITMKQDSLTLEHASYIMQIATIVMNSNIELAVHTIETMLQSFGAFVKATLASGPSTGIDLAYDERKQRCQLFVAAFKQAAPALKQVASNSYPDCDPDVCEAAQQILDQWKVFLK